MIDVDLEVSKRAKWIASYWANKRPVGCMNDILKLVSWAVRVERDKWKKAMLESTGVVTEDSVVEVKKEKRRIIRKLVTILRDEERSM
jgi:hypothetical protein